MKRLTTRSIATATAISRREEFNTSGALSARKEKGLGSWDSGKLSGLDLDVFRDDARRIVYAVWSYATPIAWFTHGMGWYVVEQKFSITTTKHQGNLYMIGGGAREFSAKRRRVRAEKAMQQVPECDTEVPGGYALSDCKHWDKPGTECAGPRVGRTRDGVILCERHYNQ
jgi:hypothetical protein